MRASVLRSGSPRQRAWASRVFLVVIVSALVGWTLIPLGRVIWRPATSYSGLEAANILKNISGKISLLADVLCWGRGCAFPMVLGTDIARGLLVPSPPSAHTLEGMPWS